MKVTMEQLVDFKNNSDFFANVSLPLKGAYKLNKIKKAVNKEAEFYGEKFQEILDKYAKKDTEGNLVFSEDGAQIMIQEDKIDECNKALEDLQKLEVEIDNYGLTIEDLSEGVECTSEELEALMPFME